jgi:hypothetical protein
LDIGTLLVEAKKINPNPKKACVTNHSPRHFDFCKSFVILQIKRIAKANRLLIPYLPTNIFSYLCRADTTSIISLVIAHDECGSYSNQTINQFSAFFDAESIASSVNLVRTRPIRSIAR